MSRRQRVLANEPIADLADHLANGGGGGLHSALHRSPASIIHSLERSNLRGRGGAGFPTGRKWRTVVANRSQVHPTPVVVNAAEGEPGTFKDRQLLRTNPYLVLEGAVIAALATNAQEIVIGVKSSFGHEKQRLHAAIAEVEAAGWVEGLEVRVVEGPSDYLFGEETALLEVLEGRPAFPRVSPPYRRGLQPNQPPTGHSAAGLHLSGATGAVEAPVLVDNVETLAQVALILRHGPVWFAEAGTPGSAGTIVCTVTGDTVRAGVGEFEMGTPLGEVIEELGGGVAEGRRIAAVLPGVSNPALGPELLDTPLTYEDMAAVGSGLGSAGFIVFDDRADLTAVAAGAGRFLAIESCGQCEPCKRDGLGIFQALQEGADPRSREVRSMLDTVARGARCALAGQTERVVGGLLDMTTTRAGSSSAPLVLPIVDIAGDTAVLDTRHLDKQPDWTYAGTDSGKWPAQRLADQAVDLEAPHVSEMAVGTPRPVRPTGEHWFTGLDRSFDAIEDAVRRLRLAAPDERPAAADELHRRLALHLDVTQRFLHPAALRAEPDFGEEIAWYPEVHEREALRLLDRIESTPVGSSPRLVDELATDVHRYIIEVELRVLPLLIEHLDEHERRGIDEAIHWELLQEGEPAGPSGPTAPSTP